MVTTGGQIILSAEGLRNEGAIVEDVLSVILREEKGRENLQEQGLTLQSLFTMQDLFEASAQN